jgi:conjugal transfer mating pair stabilization protein TraN
MLRLILLFLCFSKFAMADMNKHYQDALGFAKGKNQLPNEAIDSLLPGHDSSKRDFDKSNIANAASNQMFNNDASNFVLDSNQNRGRFNDIESNNFFKQSENFLKDPLKALTNNSSSDCMDIVENTSNNQQSLIVKCKESQEQNERSCVHNLNVTVDVIPAKYQQNWTCKGHREPKKHGKHKWWKHGPWNPNCWARKYSAPTLISPEQVNITEDWVSNCQILEGKVDQGICHYDRVECSKGPETRIINGKEIYRDCWQKKYFYNCGLESNNSCKALREKGCEQIGSICSKYIGPNCVEWEQSFACKAGSPGKNKIRKLCGTQAFCMGGDCTPQGYDNNDEMLESISYLNIFGEMSKDISKPSIFAGDQLGCKKRPLDFIDCCKTGKGWGKSIGLGKCHANEKSLSKRREKRHCKLVGTYCKEKSLGVCILKQTNFCCFGSPLLRMIQEQARAQIGLGWGTPKKPLCRGLTLAELQRVDFSKLDLSEFFAEVAARFKSQDMDEIKEKVSKRLQNLQEDIKNK